MDGEIFRTVMAQWPSGVVLVTTGSGQQWHGMTASAFASVSLSPPMVLVCLARGTRTHELVSSSGCFAVNILGQDQARLGRVFAGQGEVADRFAHGRWTAGVTGAPLLADAAGWLDCRVNQAHPGGDHTIFVGDVLAAASPRRVAPVLFHSRAWSRLADPLPERVAVADTGVLGALQAQGVDGARLAALARGIRLTGARVRLPGEGSGGGWSARSGSVGGFEPGSTPGATPGSREGSSGEDDLDPATASVFVREPGDVRRAAARGVGVVEFDAGAGADDDGAVPEAARRAGLTTVAHLRDAFAPHRAEHVLASITRLAEAGCDEIALAEGAGAATPMHVRALLGDACASAALRVGLRGGDGMGLVNALIAMKSGVSRFDTTLGGLDGALPAEDLLLLAGQLDVACTADREALLALKH
ncbi:flavin reductase [Nonomuraea soli]|uniref:Flavin reductase (DIM6/NTAB) family NADH-FMN oxidoreductase RutF n=1 Tax=Nonomuraea soli TaxID=1032476 RepID=A0A7W0CFT5_9ACTN|nr:flavin reductase [Nonomuraea soli]MBA2890374.1 flavin reductase (DIM6/NTAB) family NADH-FMN oxidoreductase RutF [Nonomuraea soli]